MVKALRLLKFLTGPAPIHQEGPGEEAKQVGPENPSNEVSNTLRYLQAGTSQQLVPARKDITDDPEVLDCIEHCHKSS